MRRTLVLLVLLVVAPLLPAQASLPSPSSVTISQEQLQELMQILDDYRTATDALQTGFDQYKKETGQLLQRAQADEDKIDRLQKAFYMVGGMVILESLGITIYITGHAAHAW